MRGSTQIITGGSATFATLGGVPGDNTALAAALEAKLDAAGGDIPANACTATASEDGLYLEFKTFAGVLIGKCLLNA